MKQIRARDPSGREWIVRRRWLPWRIRIRWLDRSRNALDGMHALDVLGIADEISPVIGVIVIVLVLGAIVFFVLPIALFLIELLLLVVIAGLAVAVRVLLRRPWLVDAIDASSQRTRYVWAVTGWRASGQAVEQVAAQIDMGTTPPLVPSGRLIEESAPS